jgi:hypothetical protein
VAPTLSSSAVAAFREQLRGWLLTPEDASYDSARRVWNGDRSPSGVDRLLCKPSGRRFCSTAKLPDEAIDVLVERFPATPSPLSAMILEHCHGDIAGVAPDATAFGLRRHPYHLEVLGFWAGADQSPANLRWVTDFFDAMHPFDVGEVYVNSLDESEGHHVREAYGGNYDRLTALKAKIRPTNFFRCNQNISLR